MKSGAAQGVTAGIGGADDRRIVGIILILAAVIFTGLRLRCASIPLERDEGEYAYIAQRMLAGELPYRDVFDQKPPGVFFAFILPVALFGASAAAIHVMLYAWTALTCAALYGVGREAAGATAGAWAVLVFAAISIEPAWLATAANTEQFMLLPMTLSVWCAQRGARTNRLAWWIASGAAAMAACWFKQVAATQIGFVAAIAIVGWVRSGRRSAKCVGDAAAFLAGMSAVGAPVLGYFAVRGAWGPFVDCVWRHNVSYSTSVPWSVGKSLLGEAFRGQAGSLWLVWLLAGATLADWRARVRGEAIFCAGWLTFSAIGISIGFYFRHHYFLQAAPALALAAGVTCARLTNRIPAGRGINGLTAALMAAAIVAPMLVAHWGFFAAGSGVEQSRMLYGMSAFGENEPLADVIRASTKPDDRVLIYGSEPQILFHAGRKSATRYIFFYPLMMELPQAEERQKEAFAEIGRSPPACIVWTHIPTSLLMQPGSSRFLEEQVGKMIDAAYRLIGLRVIDGDGVRVAREPKDVAAAMEKRRRDPEGVVVDMLIFTRRAGDAATSSRP